MGVWPGTGPWSKHMSASRFFICKCGSENFSNAMAGGSETSKHTIICGNACWHTPCSTAFTTRTKLQIHIKLNSRLHRQLGCPRDPTWDTHFPGTTWKVYSSIFLWVFSSRRYPRCQFRDSAEAKNVAWLVCDIVTEDIVNPWRFILCGSMECAINGAFLSFLTTFEVPQMASSKPSWCCVCIHPSRPLLPSGSFSSWPGSGQAGRVCGTSRCGRSWSMELLQHCLHMSTPIWAKKALDFIQPLISHQW